MKGLRVPLLVLLLTLLAAAVVIGRGAVQVAVGYSAKQLCSGVFVSGLPASFTQETDILPRMAILGPLRDALKMRVDAVAGRVSVSLLGTRAEAVHLPRRGCSLHAAGAGVPALAPAEMALPGPGVPADLIAAVDAAFAEPAGGGRNTLALLVARGNELLAERYAAPVTAGTRLQGWSMNKSLMATWVGLQAQRGALDPGQSVRELLTGEPEADKLDPDLTLLHLLQMESGLDFEEVYGPGSDVTRMLYVAPAMWKVPASRGQAYAPGEHFSYSSGDTVFASYLWQRSLDEPYEDWIARQFAAPLGIQSLVAEPDASGVQVGSSYAYLTARDWLRAGQLWLDAWHGRSELLSQDWLRESVQARESDQQGRYGRGFWLNTGGVAFEGLPTRLFYAGGNAGQYVVVIPDWELVVVRLGLTDPEVDTGMHRFLLDLAKRREPLGP
jgi:CubicO group peptidase (beta-lactamase class C family)